MTIAASVDFGLKSRKKDMSGFLAGISTTNAPGNDVIARLRPAIWRTRAGTGGVYTRLQSIDADMPKIVNLSGAYGYPLNSWNGNPAPYSDSNATWITTVTTLANYHVGQNVIFDVWNEPDYSGYWDGTQNQFFATFKAAHDTIRSICGPDAIIMGPSCATYNNSYITAFLSYCDTNALKVQAMAWHEFDDSDPSVIPANVAAIKSAVASTYTRVGVQKYYIPEHTRDTSWMMPGDCFTYLYYLQEADVDGACRACWNNVAAVNTCFDNSLTNLVDSTTYEPHAVFYAYEWYAEIKRAQVKCTSADSFLTVMASSCPIEILVGFGNSATSTTDVTLALNNLAAVGLTGSTIKADIYKVSNTGETIVNSPTVVGTQTLTVTSGDASLPLLNVNKHDLIKIVLRPGG